MLARRAFLPLTRFFRSFVSHNQFYETLNLTPEQRELRIAVEKFADDEIMPIANAVDKEDRFPRDLWPKMGEMGLLGITAEPDYGGTGLSYVEHCLVMEELSKASGSIALSYGAHSNLTIN